MQKDLQKVINTLTSIHEDITQAPDLRILAAREVISAIHTSAIVH